MLEAIKNIINKDVVCNIATADHSLVIKENAANSKIKRLKIEGIPESSFAFTLDYQPGRTCNRIFQQLSPYVDKGNSHDINRACDLVLVSLNDENECVILLLDLKSEKPSKSKTEKQLKNSELFLKYIMSMVQYHYEKDISEAKYKRAIVTVSRNSMRKSSVYRNNINVQSPISYLTKPLSVNHSGEARVHYGALLQ